MTLTEESISEVSEQSLEKKYEQEKIILLPDFWWQGKT